MRPTESTVPALAIKAGLLISAIFIIYFLIMKLFNLTHITELRFLNLAILVTGLVYTFRYFRKETGEVNIPYFAGLVLGIITSFVSFAVFTLFIYFYFQVLDPELLKHLTGSTLMLGTSPTATYAAIAVMVEGLSSGLIVSFILMQYYRSGFYKSARQKRSERLPRQTPASDRA